MKHRNIHVLFVTQYQICYSNWLFKICIIKTFRLSCIAVSSNGSKYYIIMYLVLIFISEDDPDKQPSRKITDCQNYFLNIVIINMLLMLLLSLIQFHRQKILHLSTQLLITMRSSSGIQNCWTHFSKQISFLITVSMATFSS